MEGMLTVRETIAQIKDAVLQLKKTIWILERFRRNNEYICLDSYNMYEWLHDGDTFYFVVQEESTSAIDPKQKSYRHTIGKDVCNKKLRFFAYLSAHQVIFPTRKIAEEFIAAFEGQKIINEDLHNLAKQHNKEQNNDD